MPQGHTPGTGTRHVYISMGRTGNQVAVSLGGQRRAHAPVCSDAVGIIRTGCPPVLRCAMGNRLCDKAEGENGPCSRQARAE